MIYKTIAIGDNDIRCFEDGSIQKVDGKRGIPVNTYGGFSNKGYLQSTIGGRTYLVHRLIAKAFVDDYNENMTVDHIDGVKVNNRPSNLRIKTLRDNMRSFQSMRRGVSSKYRGVYRCKNDKRWTSSFKIDGRSFYVGSFITEVEAAIAYDAKILANGFSFQATNAYSYPELAA